MKKIILIVLVLATMLSFTACGSQGKVDEMESDVAITNMLVKEALNNYIAKINFVYYNGKSPDEATIDDILLESLCDDSRYVSDYLYGDKTWLSRTIGKKEYTMVWDGHNVVLSGGDNYVSGTTLTGYTHLSSLDISEYP